MSMMIRKASPGRSREDLHAPDQDERDLQEIGDLENRLHHLRDAILERRETRPSIRLMQ